MKTKTAITAAVVATLGLGLLGVGVAAANGPFYSGMGYGPGMMGGPANCVQGQTQTLATPLTVDDVRARMEQHLQMRGNDRLKVGKVAETEGNIITAEIVTVDDSLVRTVEIDKTTGRPANAPMGFGNYGGHRGGHGFWR